jgi:hypothetical protein
MSEVTATNAAILALGNHRDGPRAIRQVRSLVARQTYQGSVTVMTLLPPLPSLPILGVDFESSCQVQGYNEQVRHHDTSDDEHAAAGTTTRSTWRAVGPPLVAAGVTPLRLGVLSVMLRGGSLHIRA